MINRTIPLTCIIGIGLLIAGTAFAQTQARSGSMPSTKGSSITLDTTQGHVTINSTMSPAPSRASPPSFEQLSGGQNYITEEQANAYPPLANDFLYVAGPNGHRISKARYEQWLQTLN